MKTAVNWLIEQLEKEYNSFPLLNAESCIKAQQMEKEQMIELWNIAVTCESFEQYYNETFKSE